MTSPSSKKSMESEPMDAVAVGSSCENVTSFNLAGFTLVELLVATAILLILVSLLINMVSQTSKTWKVTSGKIEQFRDSRDAFDEITRRLSLATLNPYLDYLKNAQGIPTNYFRQSELRFLSGPTATILAPLGTSFTSNKPTMSMFFQAPNGFATNTGNAMLQNSLNTWGFFIEYGDDSTTKPAFVQANARNRYRLMELMEPTENMSVYNYTSGTNAAGASKASTYTGIDWISSSLSQPMNTRPVHVLAENVVALILLPKLSPTDMGTTYNAFSLAPNYVFDSTTTTVSDGNVNPHNQLPPIVQVTLVAVDEGSAVRFASKLAALSDTMSTGAWFTVSANYDIDMASLQGYLTTNKINYRVFTTDVMIKGAKWSSAQKN